MPQWCDDLWLQVQQSAALMLVSLGIGSMVEGQICKDNDVFSVYGIFKPVLCHLGGFPSSLVMNSKAIMVCKSSGKTPQYLMWDSG